MFNITPIKNTKLRKTNDFRFTAGDIEKAKHVGNFLIF